MANDEAIIVVARHIITAPLINPSSAYDDVWDICRTTNTAYYAALDRCVEAASSCNEKTKLLLDHTKDILKYASLARQNIDLSLVKGTVPYEFSAPVSIS